MYSKLLIQELYNLWKYQKVTARCPEDSPKIKSTILSLSCKANELNQPIQLLISMFAHYYITICKERSCTRLSTQVNKFLYSSPFNELPKFTNDDIELAYTIRNIWNELHNISTSDLPFRTRSLLFKSKILIKKNTFFKHSSDFSRFAVIARFVNYNRLFYPQIHGMQEFFLHLPIITAFPREYTIFEYVSPERTLERYYKEIYGNMQKEERLSKFIQTLNNDSLVYLNHSNIWAAGEAISDILRKNSSSI